MDKFSALLDGAQLLVEAPILTVSNFSPEPSAVKLWLLPFHQLLTSSRHLV